jgi:hypothetical protein
MFPTERKRKHIEKLGERNISLEELNTTNPVLCQVQVNFIFREIIFIVLSCNVTS